MQPIVRTLPAQDVQLRCGEADCASLFEVRMPVNSWPISMWLGAMSAVRCPRCSSAEVLMGQDRSWPEDREAMGVDAGGRLESRAADWLETGEIGNSSRTVHEFMLRGRVDGPEHPRDASDVRRCLLLLRRVPEWAPRMEGMAAVSPEWARIAPNWDRIALAFVRDTGADYRRVPAPETAEILESILSGVGTDA